MMHELWPDHISLACSAVNLVVYKISTENTIFQDTEETYSRCVCMLCETWKGTFLILTLQYEFLFMSYLLSFFLSFFFSVFFLSVLPSVPLFISASVFRFYSHYFSDHFCCLSFFLSPVLSPGFFPLDPFSIFTLFFLSLLSIFPFFYLSFNSIHTFCRVPFLLCIICLRFYVSVLHIHPSCFMLFLNDSEEVCVLTNPPGCMNA